MTQIVTVSPPTDAYASQGMRQQQRASTLLEERIHVWSEEAKSKGDARTVAVLNVIHPPALVLALITAPGTTPQVTVTEAQRSYDENADAVPKDQT